MRAELCNSQQLLDELQRVLGLPGGKEWPGRDADPSTPSSAIFKKE